MKVTDVLFQNSNSLEILNLSAIFILVVFLSTFAIKFNKSASLIFFNKNLLFL